VAHITSSDLKGVADALAALDAAVPVPTAVASTVEGVGRHAAPNPATIISQTSMA